MTPRFSIVVPTLRRSDVLGHCLTTLLRQDFADYEIVVQNNGRDPETEAVIRGIGDHRVQHCWSDAVVRMTDNWEAGLGNARGEFVMVIGDGDGLSPDCCRIAAEVLDRTGLEIVSWFAFVYHWPDFVRPDLGNRLTATIGYDLCAQIAETESLLRSVCRFEAGFWLPMIYHSFVRRTVIERAVKTSGRYFLGSFPDVSSGIVNTTQVATFARVSRPLSLIGLSHHSSKGSMFVSDRGHSSPDAVQRDFGANPIDDRLVPGDSLELRLATEMFLEPHEALLKPFGIRMDVRRLLERMAATINHRPSFYERTRAEITALADRHCIDLSDIAIPAPLAEVQRDAGAAVPAGNHQVRFFIDGNELGLRTSADAVRAMQQLVPRLPPGEAIAIKPMQPACGTLRTGQAMTFRFSADGALGLAYGWAEPEVWGTWSAAKRALLRLVVNREREGDVHLALTYRAYVQHGMQPELRVTCRVQGMEVAAWSCGTDNATGVQRLTIPESAVSPRSMLEIEFFIMNPRSPAEQGQGSDRRLLGIGIESLELLDPPVRLNKPIASSPHSRLGALLGLSRGRN